MGKKKRTITPAYLERAALFYLQRYSSSRKNLERVLERKIRKQSEGNQPLTTEQRQWIRETSEKCINLGYIDDSRYASQKALSMHLGGKSEQAIRLYLRQKGLDDADIQTALDSIEQESGAAAALKAAIIYARKRGFGPFRLRTINEDRIQKDIAAMMRAGHQMDHIQKVIRAESKDILEDILYKD